MKRKNLLSLIIIFIGITCYAQNDTLYIMKSGIVVEQYNVNTEIDTDLKVNFRIRA